jgi:hypothetical protein
MKLSLARPISLGACLLVGLVSCIGNPDDAHDDVPGDLLGMYKVDALMEESSCGPGALGAPDHWSFDVKLSRDDSNIYWNNGDEALEGSLSSAIFSFTSEVSIPVREAKPGRPGCTLWRQDAARGTLVAGADESDVPGFDGSLTYSFAQESGSDCNDAMAEVGLAQLPCSVRYTMTATRVDE